MERLTPPQRRLLEHLLLCEERQALPPTYRELAEALGWQAPTSARDVVRALARRGCVTPSRLARGLRLTALGREMVAPVAPAPVAPAPVAPAPGGPGPERPPQPGAVPSAAHAQALRLLAPFLVRRRFPAGSTLWNAGEPASIVAVLDSGRVRIFRPLPEGGTITLFVFGPGDFFGFLPFFDAQPYPASAEATTDVRARVLTREALFAALRGQPEIAIELLKFLGLRLREAFDRIEVLSARGSIPRVAAALVGLLPREAAAPVLVTLPMAAGLFAGTLGLTPESFSRALTVLVESRVLHRLGRGRLQILDLRALRAAGTRSAL